MELLVFQDSRPTPPEMFDSGFSAVQISLRTGRTLGHPRAGRHHRLPAPVPGRLPPHRVPGAAAGARRAPGMGPVVGGCAWRAPACVVPRAGPIPPPLIAAIAQSLFLETTVSD